MLSAEEAKDLLNGKSCMFLREYCRSVWSYRHEPVKQLLIYTYSVIYDDGSL